MHSDWNSKENRNTPNNSGIPPYCSYFLPWYLLFGILFSILITKDSNKMLLEICLWVKSSYHFWWVLKNIKKKSNSLETSPWSGRRLYASWGPARRGGGVEARRPQRQRVPLAQNKLGKASLGVCRRAPRPGMCVAQSTAHSRASSCREQEANVATDLIILDTHHSSS